MVEALDPQPGQRILELASGTGETGFAAVAALGDEGRLISTDFAPRMVEVASAESQRLGLGNVEHRVLDAERMDLDDDSVDGVLCRWGYMLMADPAAALHETRRVLRDGGPLAMSVWGHAESNPWTSVAGRAVLEHTGAPPPEPTADGRRRADAVAAGRRGVRGATDGGHAADLAARRASPPPTRRTAASSGRPTGRLGFARVYDHKQPRAPRPDDHAADRQLRRRRLQGRSSRARRHVLDRLHAPGLPPARQAGPMSPARVLDPAWGLFGTECGGERLRAVS